MSEKKLVSEYEAYGHKDPLAFCILQVHQAKQEGAEQMAEELRKLDGDVPFSWIDQALAKVKGGK